MCLCLRFIPGALLPASLSTHLVTSPGCPGQEEGLLSVTQQVGILVPFLQVQPRSPERDGALLTAIWMVP